MPFVVVVHGLKHLFAIEAGMLVALPVVYCKAPCAQAESLNRLAECKI
jgi:hypothetical protein